MKSIKYVLLVLASASMLSTSPAHSREFADIYKECGIGGAIFKSNGTVAIISNVIWDLGTTAVLSNAISPDSCSGGEASAAAFAMQSYPAIERDLSKGEGEYLKTMLNMMGCEGDVQASLTDDLRVDMAKAMTVNGFESADRYGKASALFNTVDARIQQSYSTACTSV